MALLNRSTSDVMIPRTCFTHASSVCVHWPIEVFRFVSGDAGHIGVSASAGCRRQHFGGAQVNRSAGLGGVCREYNEALLNREEHGEFDSRAL
jgi:hypothetical protein